MKTEGSIRFLPNVTKWIWFYYMFINKQDNFETPPVPAAQRKGREQLLWAIARCLPTLILRSRVKCLCRVLMVLQSNLLRSACSRGNSSLTSRLRLRNHFMGHDGQTNWSCVKLWMFYGTGMEDKTINDAVTPYWVSKRTDLLQFGKAMTREKQGEAKQGMERAHDTVWKRRG